MGTLFLSIVLFLTLNSLLQGHIFIAFLPWVILGIGAYLRPPHPWGKDGPK
jgi:hypothetical protein